MVIEGTLGLTAFNFITRYLEDSGQLPGFVEGYSRIHHDEQRHIGYGTWFLREAVRRDPALADSVRATLRAALPAVAEALTPPDRDGHRLGGARSELRGDPRLRDHRACRGASTSWASRSTRSECHRPQVAAGTTHSSGRSGSFSPRRSEMNATAPTSSGSQKRITR